MSSAATVSGTHVWDALWQHRSDRRCDLAQLDREERNPRWALVCETLRSTFGGIKGLRTIELGSGRGDMSALLAARGAEVTLLDYSDQALDQARERFDRLGLEASFVRGDMLGGLDGVAGEYDVSCSLGVIEHFRGADRARVVAAHRRVLHDRGLAVISAPHAWGVAYRLWKMYLEIRGWWPYGLEIPYRKGELCRLGTAAGFGFMELHTTGFWQSVGDHWGRSVLGLSTDWVTCRSALDSAFGSTLTLLARAERR